MQISPAHIPLQNINRVVYKYNNVWTFCFAGLMDSFNYEKKGYAWAVLAGFNAALAAIAAKFFSSQLVRYGLVIILNAVMWGCYVNSLKALSSLQATVTNFATNFLSSGLAGYFLFEEVLQFQWFAGAMLIVVGVIVLSKSSKVQKTHSN